MKTCEDMSREYKKNTAALKQRCIELKDMLRHASSPQEKLDLQKRIYAITSMIGDSNMAVYLMSKYVEKGSESLSQNNSYGYNPKN